MEGAGSSQPTIFWNISVKQRNKQRVFIFEFIAYFEFGDISSRVQHIKNIQDRCIC